MTSIRPNGRVEFRFFRPNALSVKVLGTFNEWRGDALAMESAGDGWWTLDADFEPGEYRFRYLAGDQWYTDFAAFGIEPCKYGWNSVLIVPERQSVGRGNNKGRFVHDTTAKLAA